MDGILSGHDLDLSCGKMGTFYLFCAQPTFDFLIDFMKILIEARKEYRDFFIYGSQYRTGVLDPKPAILKYDIDEFGPTINPGPFPAVTSGLWVNEERNKLLIFVISNTLNGYVGKYIIYVN